DLSSATSDDARKPGCTTKPSSRYDAICSALRRVFMTGARLSASFRGLQLAAPAVARAHPPPAPRPEPFARPPALSPRGAPGACFVAPGAVVRRPRRGRGNGARLAARARVFVDPGLHAAHDLSARGCGSGQCSRARVVAEHTPLGC